MPYEQRKRFQKEQYGIKDIQFQKEQDRIKDMLSPDKFKGESPCSLPWKKSFYCGDDAKPQA
jgi:hypothetical protein